MMLLPHDRPMTADERRGFRMACACFASWGAQVGRESIKLGGPLPAPPPIYQMQQLGRQITFMAEALDRTLGQGTTPG